MELISPGPILYFALFLFVVLAFFILNFFLKRKVVNKTKRYSISFLLSIILSFLVVLFIFITTFSLGNCNSFKKEYGIYKVESNTYSSTITLCSDSTFIERRKSKIESKNYCGHWRYINITDSIIETTIESSGADIYTLTPERKYKIRNGKLIVISKD